MITEEIQDINDNDTFTCKDCSKHWYGWAIKDNRGNCPDCSRCLL